MSADDVAKNYSALGAALIEQLYSNDYMSIGGTASTDILAAEAGITADSRVLDIGSGLGGPALHLAETRGCRVTGLDLVEGCVDEATRRGEARGLDRLADFRTGDATALPFDDACFDVVWGQDAWCHVPDKDRLIAEAMRVVAPGGCIAFTDWLQTGPMDDARLSAVLDASASTNMATMPGYCGLLEKHGATVLKHEDISAPVAGQYRAVMARLERAKAEITEKFGARVYAVMHDKNGRILRAFEDNLIGIGRIVARAAA